MYPKMNEKCLKCKGAGEEEKLEKLVTFRFPCTVCKGEGKVTREMNIDEKLDYLLYIITRKIP